MFADDKLIYCDCFVKRPRKMQIIFRRVFVFLPFALSAARLASLPLPGNDSQLTLPTEQQNILCSRLAKL